MMKTMMALVAFVWALMGGAAEAACDGLLNFQTRTLSGEPQDLCQYQGKVVLVVNTASYCGFTSQYEGLEKLYQRYRERGLVVLGFPANDFGRQEPGSNEQVKDFCERTFKVRFPMLEKTVVVGGDANALYRQLAIASGQAPKWNFHKYVVGRDGKVAASYASEVKPESQEIVSQVEKLLAVHP